MKLSSPLSWQAGRKLDGCADWREDWRERGFFDFRFLVLAAPMSAAVTRTPLLWRYSSNSHVLFEPSKHNMMLFAMWKSKQCDCNHVRHFSEWLAGSEAGVATAAQGCKVNHTCTPAATLCPPVLAAPPVLCHPTLRLQQPLDS